MAVKVMVAPAIAQRDASGSDRRLPAAGEARPRRRRASVYDAEGNEVFITLLCLKCHKMRPLAQFGLRRMADGAIRNQPWCRTCRGAIGNGQGRKSRRGDAAEPAVAANGGEPSAAEPVVDAGVLAAQVVAALHGGRR
jgi:hypothetical protein